MSPKIFSAFISAAIGIFLGGLIVAGAITACTRSAPDASTAPPGLTHGVFTEYHNGEPVDAQILGSAHSLEQCKKAVQEAVANAGAVPPGVKIIATCVDVENNALWSRVYDGGPESAAQQAKPRVGNHGGQGSQEL